MSSQEKRESIYVELDVLLDTRLGTLALIDDQVAASVIASGNYHTRKNDIFEGVDKEVFDEAYRNRDETTLKKSVLTDAIKVLRQLVVALTEQTIDQPDHEGPKIVVNLYPYKLTAEEQELIGRSMADWIQNETPIELVAIPTKDLTPIYCKTTYSTMLVYDHSQWMNTHAEAFKKTCLPEVIMISPAIYFNATPSDEELAKTIKEAAHPMRALELLASPIIELKLIDVKYFSILTTNK
jgi:hypothetical protein